MTHTDEEIERLLAKTLHDDDWCAGDFESCKVRKDALGLYVVCFSQARAIWPLIERIRDQEWAACQAATLKELDAEHLEADVEGPSRMNLKFYNTALTDAATIIRNLKRGNTKPLEAYVEQRTKEPCEPMPCGHPKACEGPKYIRFKSTDPEPHEYPIVCFVCEREQKLVEALQQVRQSFVLWARTKGDYQLAADIDHSSLLGRILEGKQPLPFAPPKRFSYPDYPLAEGEQADCLEVWIDPEGFLVVDQSAWSKPDILADGSYKARWKDSPYEARFWRDESGWHGQLTDEALAAVRRTKEKT